jgi:hypothetical protein
MTETKATVVRHGRVLLGESLSTPPTRQSFLVREWSDGFVEYRLGDAARTSDGWVSLPSAHKKNVSWEDEA